MLRLFLITRIQIFLITLQKSCCQVFFSDLKKKIILIFLPEKHFAFFK